MGGKSESVDILIVGAGPTGLALALALRSLGVAPLIVDKAAAPAETSRAAAIHARTLEVLEPLGATGDLIAAGLKLPGFAIHDRDRELLAVDFTGLPTPYPFTLACPQDRTEAILHRHLHMRGGEVIRACEAIAVRPDTSGVTVGLRRDGTEHEIRARWLVGCDGMHSLVREHAGIPFEGGDYEESFILADVHMDRPLDRERLGLFLSADGLLVSVPLPENRFRLIATVEAAPEQPSLAEFQEILSARGPQAVPGHIEDSLWMSRFHVHHRLARSPREGRVLLCGDAAHVHSPAGGQGMNTGIQDAVALAGVLAKVLAGGDEADLDDWSERRHEVAQGVVAMTDRLTRVATLRGRTITTLRNAAISLVGHIPSAREALARRLAELDS